MENKLTHSQDATLPAYNPKGFSLGALGGSTLWLFANGFWLTALICAVSAFYFWPLQVAITLLFAFKGREWSWGGGQRWESAQAFEESQSVWNIIGGILLGFQGSVIAVFSWQAGALLLGLRELF